MAAIFKSLIIAVTMVIATQAQWNGGAGANQLQTLMSSFRQMMANTNPQGATNPMAAMFKAMQQGSAPAPAAAPAPAPAPAPTNNMAAAWGNPAPAPAAAPAPTNPLATAWGNPAPNSISQMLTNPLAALGRAPAANPMANMMSILNRGTMTNQAPAPAANTGFNSMGMRLSPMSFMAAPPPKSFKEQCYRDLASRGFRASDAMSDTIGTWATQNANNPILAARYMGTDPKWRCLVNSFRGRDIAGKLSDYMDTAAELVHLIPNFNICENVFCGEGAMSPISMMNEAVVNIRRAQRLFGRNSMQTRNVINQYGGGFDMTQVQNAARQAAGGNPMSVLNQVMQKAQQFYNQQGPNQAPAAANPNTQTANNNNPAVNVVPTSNNQVNPTGQANTNPMQQQQQPSVPAQPPSPAANTNTNNQPMNTNNGPTQQQQQQQQPQQPAVNPSNSAPTAPQQQQQPTGNNQVPAMQQQSTNPMANMLATMSNMFGNRGPAAQQPTAPFNSLAGLMQGMNGLNMWRAFEGPMDLPDPPPRGAMMPLGLSSLASSASMFPSMAPNGFPSFPSFPSQRTSSSLFPFGMLG